MAIEPINIGNVVNDGLGDDLRTAFDKVNKNFESLDEGITTTARNIGSTGQGIFAQKVDNELQFKNLVGGNNITLAPTNESIVINTTTNAFTTIVTADDSSSILSSNYSELTLEGANGIEVTSNESTITFGISNFEIRNFDFGPFDGSYSNPISFLFAASNIDFGTIESPGSLNLDLGALV